jgi:hypothetical protein
MNYRVKWYEERSITEHTGLIRKIREDKLPEWLREECDAKPIDRKFKASRFKETGVPFRAEHFLEI